jgi:hypothetical protein
MGFFKKKSISFTSNLNGATGCCNTLGGGIGLREFVFTDNFGYNYGTEFEEFTTDFLQFPDITVEGPGTYYRDPLTGTFYNDFVFNLNTPDFGGDGSSLEPAWVKTIFNGNSFTDMYMFPYEFTVISENAFNEQGELNLNPSSCEISIDNNNTFFTQLYLNDSAIYLSAYNNTSNRASLLTLENDSISFKHTEFSIVNNGIDMYESAGIYYTSFLSSNIAQSATSAITFITDPTSSTQPIKLNISGIKAYANLAAATADGLTTGDIFRIGETLSIVP